MELSRQVSEVLRQVLITNMKLEYIVRDQLDIFSYETFMIRQNLLSMSFPNSFSQNKIHIHKQMTSQHKEFSFQPLSCPPHLHKSFD